MSGTDTLEPSTGTAGSPDRRRPDRGDAVPTLVALLRHAADAVELPPDRHGIPQPGFSLDFKDVASAAAAMATDARNERGLVVKIVATVCVICLAMAALSS